MNAIDRLLMSEAFMGIVLGLCLGVIIWWWLDLASGWTLRATKPWLDVTPISQGETKPTRGPRPAELYPHEWDGSDLPPSNARTGASPGEQPHFNWTPQRLAFRLLWATVLARPGGKSP